MGADLVMLSAVAPLSLSPKSNILPGLVFGAGHWSKGLVLLTVRVVLLSATQIEPEDEVATSKACYVIGRSHVIWSAVRKGGIGK